MAEKVKKKKREKKRRNEKKRKEENAINHPCQRPGQVAMPL